MSVLPILLCYSGGASSPFFEMCREPFMLLSLYRWITLLAGPAVRVLLARRQRLGKEDPARVGERLGHAGRARPGGKLIWCHAASVGESLSVLALIERLLALDPALTVLVTSGTVTSAGLLAARLPQKAFHQYVPVDLPGAVGRFLDYWRPTAALLVESEIWPNLLGEITLRRIPAALLNARMSAKSARAWRWAPRSIARLLASFDIILAQSAEDAARFASLGAKTVRAVGNLKYAAAPSPAEPDALAALTQALGQRKVWLFASSHPGEEEQVAMVHATLKARWPDILTIIAPRHPHRGEAVAVLLAGAGLTASRRSLGAIPEKSDDVYVVDTLGELGLFFRVCPVVCVGGSLVPWGGHNPIEPAQLGAGVLFGPFMGNFAAIAAELIEAGAALRVADADGLAAAIAGLFTHPTQGAALARAAATVAGRHLQVLDITVQALQPVLEGAPKASRL